MTRGYVGLGSGGAGGSGGRRLLALALAANVGAAFAILSAAPAFAAANSISTQPQHPNPNVGQDSNHAIKPGDWVAVGFIASADQHASGTTSLYLENVQAVLSVTCTQNSSTIAQQLVVTLPQGPYTAQTDGSWSPSNQWQNPSTYQAAVTVGSPCGSGQPIYLAPNGEYYSGSLAASSTTDSWHLQFHTAIPGANNQPNIDCASASANPSPGSGACNFNQNGDQDHIAPAAYVNPTPTSTPSPSLTAGPTSTPTSASGNGSGNGSGVTSASPSPTPSGRGNSQQSASVLGGSRTPSGGGGTTGSSSGGASAAGITGADGIATGNGAVSSGAPQAPVAVSQGPQLPILAPLPVIAPLVSNVTGSLFSHLPMTWFAVLAAVDVVLALAIIARRRRVQEPSTRS